jgi:5'-3' exonuclease
MPIRQVYVSDCEADDVIGYMSRYSFKDRNILIVSSDHDYLQLVDDRIQVWSPTLKSIVDPEMVKVKFGVPPKNLCVTRCFTGDASDALPGIHGVGLRTMVNMFPDLATDKELSVDDIIDLCAIHPKRDRIKVLKAINDNCEIARRNWKLMSLDVSNLSGNQVQKINGSFEIPTPKPDKMGFIRQLVKHGIKTFDADRFHLTITLNLRNE